MWRTTHCCLIIHRRRRREARAVCLQDPRESGCCLQNSPIGEREAAGGRGRRRWPHRAAVEGQNAVGGHVQPEGVSSKSRRWWRRRRRRGRSEKRRADRPLETALGVLRRRQRCSCGMGRLEPKCLKHTFSPSRPFWWRRRQQWRGRRLLWVRPTSNAARVARRIQPRHALHGAAQQEKVQSGASLAQIWR